MRRPIDHCDQFQPALLSCAGARTPGSAGSACPARPGRQVGPQVGRLDGRARPASKLDGQRRRSHFSLGLRHQLDGRRSQMAAPVRAALSANAARRPVLGLPPTCAGAGRQFRAATPAPEHKLIEPRRDSSRLSLAQDDSGPLGAPVTQSDENSINRPAAPTWAGRWPAQHVAPARHTKVNVGMLIRAATFTRSSLRAAPGASRMSKARGGWRRSTFAQMKRKHKLNAHLHILMSPPLAANGSAWPRAARQPFSAPASGRPRAVAAHLNKWPDHLEFRGARPPARPQAVQCLPVLMGH